MYYRHRPTLAFITLLLGTLVAAHAQTYIHVFTGGENDPGATNGAAVNNPTLDSAGSTNLTLTGGNVTYTATTPGANSTLAYQFTGGSGYLLGATNLSLIDTSSFAMELWFQTTSASTQQALFHNGNLGLYIFGDSQVRVHRGGIALDIIGSISSNTWYHAAFVWDNGTLTGYLNGTPTFIGSELVFNNPTAGDALVIGSTHVGGDRFMGIIDHARVFQFATGTFNASMLSYPASAITPIPEPSTYAALAGLLALGLVAYRRRRA
jgi:hypothetical protein